MSVFNIGAPAHDGFTQSVFDHSLQDPAAQKLALSPVELDDLRAQLKKFVLAVAGDKHSLDLVADAPGGLQRLGKSPISQLLDDPQSTLDEELVSLIQARFSQCRLLGCATALDEDDRTRMLRLSQMLGMPVIGTLRAIAYPDFGGKTFQDTQQVEDEETSIVFSTSRMIATRRRLSRRFGKWLASGIIQETWLRRFRQVEIERDGLVSDPSDAPVLRAPRRLLEDPVAATDVIRTAPIGVVSLRLEGGLRTFAEVLASGTLLRLRSLKHGVVYVNVLPKSELRRELLLRMRPTGPSPLN